MKTSQFCFSPRNLASRALTKNTIAWLTGVLMPCLELENIIIEYKFEKKDLFYFLASATTLPLIKSTSDWRCFKTSTHIEVLFSWREAITSIGRLLGSISK